MDEETLRAGFYAEISALEDRILELKSQINELAKVSRLPDELLCVVFALYKEKEFSLRGYFFSDRPDYSLPSRRDLLSWTKITRVCRRWRAAAIDCPSLWGDLAQTMRLPWLNRAISRAKEAPLSIRFLCTRIPMSQEEQVLVPILSRVGQLRRVCLEGIPTVLEDILKSWTQSAPHLEELSIFPKPARALISLPSPFINSCAPKLKHLSLWNCLLPANASSLQALTRLAITMNTADAGLQLDLLLDALSSSPSITTLSLSVSRLESSSPTVLHRSPIPLRQLKSLELKSTCQGCADLLGRLHLPSTVSFHVDGYGTTSSALKNLRTALITSWVSAPLVERPPPKLCIKDLIIDSYSGGNLLCKGCVGARRDEGGHPFSFLFAVGGNDRIAPLLRSIAELLPLSYAQSLQLNDSWLRHEDYVSLLSVGFPEVRSLDIEHGSAEYVLAYLRSDPALQSASESTVQSRPSLVYFPNLTSLTITCAYMIQERRSMDGLCVSLRQLMKLLGLRSRLGYRLKELHFYGCYYISKSGSQRFEEVVDEVNWTERERWDDRDDYPDEEQGSDDDWWMWEDSDASD
ncbi:hypothetical protein CC1G_08830 [Coprinopsis cinerea okayama7|uniref:Uncharacterized protein n=1 Tax=Coprinopsis cinerea (strain Okayama-7 / 130 / ATCC MYA-4618 / FGSC 9003) TaxID=240176 RepID=A8P689_COPC7|nr:hypothetical protein CC1G_08830 [Coprinopsis cinerea okayama7\|eukprot:XP_001839104.1 hypothetical protein CC1G_08830 [Coprinopsis cinerea okayama7\